MRSNLHHYIFVVVIYGIFLAHAVFLECVAEDAYITFRFARNVASGDGLVWNVGEPPVEGFTNFLWVMVCALVIKLGLPLPEAAQVLGIAASLGTLAFAYRFGVRLLGLEPRVALIPCVLLAASGPFATWATSGMETSAFTLFVVMGCYYFGAYWKQRRMRLLVASAAALLLATLTRPEGFMVTGVLIGFGTVLSLGEGRRTARDGLVALASFVVPFALYFAWRLNYFGYLLPNTFYAKTGGGANQYVRGFVHTMFFGMYFVLPLAFLPVILWWERGPQRRLSLRGVVANVRERVALVTCGLVGVVYALYIIYVGGDYMAMFRFFVPILPLLYLFAGAIAGRVYEAVAEVPRKRNVVTGLLGLVVAAFLVQSSPLERRLFVDMPNNHGTYRGVQYERWHVARLSLIGRYFREVRESYEESLSTTGIGAIGYFADMVVLDPHGLVDTYITHEVAPPADFGSGLPGHERESLEYILSRAPTYFMYDRVLSEEPTSYPSRYSEEVKQTLEARYSPVSVWLHDEVNGEEGYFTYLRRKRGVELAGRSP